MTAPSVWTFFYGSFINLEVLEAQGLVPERYEVARLIPTCAEQDSSQFAVRSIATQAFLAVARVRVALANLQ